MDAKKVQENISFFLCIKELSVWKPIPTMKAVRASLVVCLPLVRVEKCVNSECCISRDIPYSHRVFLRRCFTTEGFLRLARFFFAPGPGFFCAGKNRE